MQDIRHPRFTTVHVIKRGKNYQAYWTILGVRYYKALGGNRQYANEARAAIEQTINYGPQEPTATTTNHLPLQIAIDEYVAECRRMNHAPRTITMRQHSLSLLAAQSGLRTVDMISGTEIIAYLEQRRSENLSPDTINGHLRNLKAFFNYLIANDKIARSPAKNIKQSPSNAALGIAKDKLIPRADIPKILAAAQKDSDPIAYDFLMVALHTGLRAGELLRLTGNDLHFEAETPFIHVRSKDGSPLKNRREGGRRTPMHQAIRECLQRRQTAAAGGYLFSSDRTEGARPSGNTYLAKMCSRIAAAAGIGHLSPHMLRHTFNTALTEAGVDVTIRQQLCDHADAATNAGYTHISLKVLQTQLGSISFAHTPNPPSTDPATPPGTDDHDPNAPSEAHPEQ